MCSKQPQKKIYLEGEQEEKLEELKTRLCQEMEEQTASQMKLKCVPGQIAGGSESAAEYGFRYPESKYHTWGTASCSGPSTADWILCFQSRGVEGCLGRQSYLLSTANTQSPSNITGLKPCLDAPG